MIGTRLAHYEITSHLGTGGMGEVSQAADSKLGRSVAIKLLPEAFTHDPGRASRLEREAHVLASLNHPNIAAIYGIEESAGRKFLVMELAGGETLAERIKRGAIPIDEALGIARQIAEGLEAAHEKGIIHRDLKPANVKIAPDGKVKILDFGLAKACEPETGNASLSGYRGCDGTGRAGGGSGCGPVSIEVERGWLDRRVIARRRCAVGVDAARAARVQASDAVHGSLG
ncbi:MAG: serine/threonine protein kinase [Acidobacteria bacterium]|nr:serine/threonine protein kinase [Acidobacteriota bacterium]